MKVAAAKLARTVDENAGLRKFLTVIRENEATFDAPIAGVLDVDLVELARHYEVDKLPADVRFMAVQEVAECVRRVNKRVHGHKHDDIPFGWPSPVTFTVQEFKEAMAVL